MEQSDQKLEDNSSSKIRPYDDNVQPMISDMNDEQEDVNQKMDNMNIQNNNMQFSDEEIQNLREIFDLFDKENQGAILANDLEAIMQSLQRDPEEAQALLN